jgi:hypothetical protein
MSKSPGVVAALEASMASTLAKNLPADSPELAQLPLALPMPKASSIRIRPCIRIMP